jgi:hypothetical protein
MSRFWDAYALEPEPQRNGKDFLVGRLGGCWVLILENDRREGDDGNTHWLLLGEAEDRPREGLAGGARARVYGREGKA